MAGLVAQFATGVFGAPPLLLPKIIFATSGVLALAVCVYLTVTTVEIPQREMNTEVQPPLTSGAVESVPSKARITWFAQPLVRWVALMTSWATTLAVATYALFATRFLAYTQSDINWVFSAGAAVAVCVQLGVVPALSRRLGEEAACATGLAVLGVSLFTCSLVCHQPAHLLLFLAFRAGLTVAETTNAALTAANSRPDKRAQNLGLLQSTQVLVCSEEARSTRRFGLDSASRRRCTILFPFARPCASLTLASHVCATCRLPRASSALCSPAGCMSFLRQRSRPPVYCHRVLCHSSSWAP